MTSEEYQEFRARLDRENVEANRAALRGDSPPPKKKRKRKNNQPEAKLQSACVRWFKTSPRYKGCVLFAVPNGSHLAGTGKRRAIQVAMLKKEGMLPGAADLVLVVPGRTVFLECKVGKNGQTPDQEEFQARVEATGHAYYVFRSLEEFQAIVASVMPSKAAR